jgi:gas vesicle protein
MFYWGLLIGVILGANVGLLLAGLLMGNKLRANALLSE